MPVADDRSGAITLWQGVRFDITQEKEAEERLRAAEERYRLVVEQLPAIAYVDERRDIAGSRTWPCVYVSPQVETILGFTPEEWVSGPETWDDMIHPDDLERAAEADTRHYELGEPVDVEIRIKARDGEYRWIRDQAVIVYDDEGEPRWSQGIWLDVTERKLAELALEEAEHRYRGIVEHVPAAIYLDKVDASMESVYVSPQIETIAGVTPERWMAEPDLWLRLTDGEDRDRVEASYLQAAEARRPWSAEYRMHTPDGRTIWVHDETTFLVGPDGEPRYMQGVIFDITERKLAEQALRESEQREREAAERLRSLDEMKNTFLAAVSHELRSPLTSILGLSITLERAQAIADEDRADLLGRLAGNARKLDRLLKDLLDIDRLNRGIVEPQLRMTDVGALARRTVENLDALAGREVAVRTDAVMLAVDPPKVERIVENLLVNAGRHTEAGRRIWLDVAPSDARGADPASRTTARASPRRCAPRSSSRSGRGRPATSHAPGTGVGLSLVARFAELHGGRAWVEPREGGGASFRVYIPGGPAEGADATPAAPPRPADTRAPSTTSSYATSRSPAIARDPGRHRPVRLVVAQVPDLVAVADVRLQHRLEDRLGDEAAAAHVAERRVELLEVAADRPDPSVLGRPREPDHRGPEVPHVAAQVGVHVRRARGDSAANARHASTAPKTRIDRAYTRCEDDPARPQPHRPPPAPADRRRDERAGRERAGRA